MLKKRHSVLGMNARSSIYLRVNTKRARARADNKLVTKNLLTEQGVGTADLLAVLKERKEVTSFDWSSLPNSFVIKPNQGFGGAGILVIYNRLKNGNWLTTNKQQLTEEDLRVHVLNVLDGNYSLFDAPDTALIESRLSVDPLFKRFSQFGIPDLGVIVYNLVPVMAFLRVPTKKSGGKANLAQGGLAIGIDVTTGLTTHVVTKSWLYEKEIDRHPDNNLLLRGVYVPYWDQILRMAVMATQALGLKYTRVDMSVDKKKGPVVLELNARPGLGIQVANMTPLRERLHRLSGLKVETPERGIAIAKDLFSGHFDAEVANITGRKVIGLIEPVTLYTKEAKPKKVLAKTDTGADDSSIDEQLARELGFGDAIDAFKAAHIPENITDSEAKAAVKKLEPELRKAQPDITRLSVVSSSHGVSVRVHIRIDIQLGGFRMTIAPNVYDRSALKYKLLIGRRNLSRFLIDPTKRKSKLTISKLPSAGDESEDNEE